MRAPFDDIHSHSISMGKVGFCYCKRVNSAINIMQKKLHESSKRVKCVDLHKTEPWVVSGLYDGNVNVYNYDTGKLLKTFDVCDLPLRCCKFVCSRHWILCGSDDFHVRAFNYNTSAKITDFEAHSDFIRYVRKLFCIG